MSLLDALSTVFLSALLIASALYQFKFKWMLPIIQRDVFHLLPKFTFFAPNPGHTDYHLLYRDSLADTTLTEWIEVPLAQERTLLAAFWNPQKRFSKSTLDLTQALITSGSKSVEDDNALILSIPYLLLLNYVTSLARPSMSRARQFVIFQSHGFFPTKEPDLLIRSGLHELDQTL